MEKTITYIGIDNGITGAISVLSDNGIVLFCKNIPIENKLYYTKKVKHYNRINLFKLIEILSVYKNYDCFCYIERPMINPKRFIASLSAIIAWVLTTLALEYCKIAYETIDSKKWQKDMLPVGIDKKDLKKVSIEVCKRLFPKVDNLSDGMADSLLIAEFLRRNRK